MKLKIAYIHFFIGFALLVLSQKVNGQSEPEIMLEGFRFTEGPAVNSEGVLYFSDVPARRIYKYDFSGDAQVFVDQSGGVNGLFFTDNDELIACSGKEIRAILSIDSQGKATEIVSTYQGKKLNSPNDLWVDQEGGIYFTDPRYGNRDGMEQDGEHVYYVFPDRKRIIRVIDDLVRPNGIVGTFDGKNLYVVDQGEQKTYVYKVKGKGKLKGKRLFADCGIDGMSVNSRNEVFITAEKALRHYDSAGKLLRDYPFEVNPTNVFFHQNQLYATTQAGQVFRISSE